MPGAVTRVEVAASLEGPPAQMPVSNVMFTTMGYEGTTHHLSWVGTNSTTGPDRLTLVLTKQAGTEANFTVDLWY